MNISLGKPRETNDTTNGNAHAHRWVARELKFRWLVWAVGTWDLITSMKTEHSHDSHRPR